MTTDVAEREATQTETEATTEVETEESSNRGLTDNQQSSQTETGTERTTTEGTATTPTDTRQARVTALAQAEREEAVREGREAAIAEFQGTTTEQQRAAAKQKLKSAFPTAQSKIDEVFRKAVYEDGSPRALNVDEQTAVKNALAGYNLVADTAVREDVATEVAQIAFSILPRAAQEELNKLTTEDMALPEYLNAWVETAALHTKAVKNLTLEDATKASPKIKRELAARDLEQFDLGREQGRIDPPGTSPDRGRAGERSAPGTKSYIDLEDGYGKGELNKAEEAEYIKLRDARKKTG